MDNSNNSLKNISKKLIIDIIAGTSASFIISPCVTVFDKALIENANGKYTLIPNIRKIIINMLQNPIAFIKRKEFLLIHGLYTCTYITANSIDTISNKFYIDSTIPKLVGTTMINVPLCVAKDRIFTRMFGVIKPTSFPITSLVLFTFRDSMTIGSSFIAPTVISKYLHSNTNYKLQDNSFIQFICPLCIQFISTPFHLFGLDLYNRPNTTIKNRITFISKEYIKSTTIRICRTIPAFGFGGISNNYFRNKMQIFCNKKLPEINWPAEPIII
jgi:hypothetical protein